jgi:four helix bundle protein
MPHRAEGNAVKSHRDLIVWQRALELCTAIYKTTARFPGEEKFGLVSQMRRAAVSIPSNIAEGHGRLTTSEYRHFLGIARGSLKELETQILIAHRLGYLGESATNACRALAGEVSRMLSTLITALQRRSG